MAKIDQSNPPAILIVAGGTGGHVFPALSVAQELKLLGYQVSWLGTARGIEAKLVPNAGLALDIIPISGLRGKGALAWIGLPWRLLKAVMSAKAIIRKRQPSLVLGFGGFVTGPAGIAAKLSGVPLVLHEQNAIPGMTNRYLAKIAKQVLCAFPNTFPSKLKPIVTGNPIRESIMALSRHSYSAEAGRKLHLLVVGGSLGALVLNETVPAALALLPEDIRPEVWHQTGEKTLETAKTEYAKYQVNANIVPFIDDMAAAYAWADVVICRAGALTIAELAAAKRPAILIPYAHAVDDHQRLNAEHLANSGAAVCIIQAELSKDKLARILNEWLSDRDQLLQRSQKAAAMAEPMATKNVVEACLSIISQRRDKA